MATRLRTIPPIVNESFLDFSGRVADFISNLDEIQLYSFEVSRVESSRGGNGYQATIMYNDLGGTYYNVHYAEGTPQEAEERYNEALKFDVLSRVRFLKVLDTGNQRRLSIGLISISAALPYESQVGRQATLMAKGPDVETTPPGGSIGMAVEDRNENIHANLMAINAGPIDARRNQTPFLAWRDPSSPEWYFYPLCPTS
ncbi:MAG: hypothetical protein F6K48_03020 [Okeania sp. SIO3H1]|nr:hypothetical protein [Okeania sp. SIO3H1]